MGFLSKIFKGAKKLVSKVTDFADNPLFTIGSNIIGGLWTNNEASAAAQKQMDFQRDMSNTSYQRATADMRAAGLNPALAYSQGGASTPMGAGYTPQNVAKDATSAGLAHQAQLVQLQNVAADTRNKDVMTDKIRADTIHTNANTARVIADNNKRDVMGDLWGLAGRGLDNLKAAGARGVKAMKDANRKATQEKIDRARRQGISIKFHGKD